MDYSLCLLLSAADAVDDIEKYGNLVEAGLWSAIGLCFVVSAIRPRNRWTKLVAGAVFIVFGGSDFVESATGAWWTPWWLLAWKVACVLALVTLLVRYYRIKRAARRA